VNIVEANQPNKEKLAVNILLIRPSLPNHQMQASLCFHQAMNVKLNWLRLEIAKSIINKQRKQRLNHV